MIRSDEDSFILLVAHPIILVNYIYLIEFIKTNYFPLLSTIFLNRCWISKAIPSYSKDVQKSFLEIYIFTYCDDYVCSPLFNQ